MIPFILAAIITFILGVFFVTKNKISVSRMFFTMTAVFVPTSFMSNLIIAGNMIIPILFAFVWILIVQ